MSLLLPFMVSRGNPVYSAIFHGNLNAAFDYNAAAGTGQIMAWRNVIKPAGGFGKGGTKLKLVLSADLTGYTNDLGLYVDHVGVGVWTGTGANTVATPVPVTTGGVASWRTAGAFVCLQSDEFTLPFLATDGLVVCIDTGSAAHGAIAGGSPGLNPGCTCWYKVGAASYNVATATGYTQTPNASFPQGLIGVLNIGAK
jgi:hypothetical protein